jgi:deoxyadenosine/deoxycytidine kinase
MPRLLVITGNIASGKTTLLNSLDLGRYGPQVAIVPEPVDEWAQIKAADGKTFFDKMYHNLGPQSAFHFQIVAITTRVTLLREALKQNPQAVVFVCERSATEDCRVFAQMFFESGRMSADELQMIELMHKQWEMCFDEPAHYAHVTTQPAECEQRLRGRLQRQVRPSEAAIDPNYLRALDAAYEAFLATLSPTSLTRLSAASQLQALLDSLVNGG